MSIVAGIDSSTQSCTVSLHDSDSGALLAVGSSPHPPTSPPNSEQHPQVWWDALRTALEQACHRAGRSPVEIDAISVAAQYHGLVALGSDDQVLRPAKLWNDTTSSTQAERLASRWGGARWARTVGSIPRAAHTITKLDWLRENEPNNFDAIRSLLVPHDWITFRLTGEKVTDRVDASGTGYFDATNNRWCTEALDLVERRDTWESMLPKVVGPNERAGRAATPDAEMLGLRPDTIVAAGTGDQAAAALALGVEDGDIVISLGTSGTVYGSSSAPVFDVSGMADVTANARGGFQPITVLLNAAKVTDTFCRILDVDHDGLAQLALDADAREIDRPLLVAFLDGERTPNRPNARGLLGGLSSATSRESIALAAFEGVALGLSAGLDALKAIGVETGRRLILTGGAAKSEAYRAVIARVFQRDLHVAEGDSSLDSARGAAIQATAALHLRPVAEVVKDWARPFSVAGVVDARVSPRMERLKDAYSLARDIRSLDNIFSSSHNSAKYHEPKESDDA